jgi:2-amino-4-hydroxy-6-hydroxymethyldihydropteridine diphosphokinase|tara:strand:+ start:1002 stop:1475 length:474 start_codon:yes stop_codon:yes gene_type:complete
LKNLNSIFLSLGTNVGDKNKNLLEGLTFLKEFVNILSISSVYKTEPLLYEDQEDFLNIVTEIDYQGTAKSLLLIIKDIEIQMGRKKTFRYGPRIIDIDIIFFKGEEINEEDLIIPHYDWHNRLFVIQPLYELLNKPLNKSNYKIHEQKIIKIGKIEL